MHTQWLHRLALGAFLLASALLGSTPAAAQPDPQAEKVYEGVGVDQRLGDYVPHDLVFRNEAGEPVELGAYLDGERPVLLTLVYHDCPMLCNLLLDGFTATLSQMAWTPGETFEVLTVSFNAIETPELAARQKARYLAQLDNPDAAAGWHFLTGDQAAIDALTEAVGFNYRWVEAQQEYVHPTALVVLSGEGQIMRYLANLKNPPRDVRAALVEASEGAVGSVLDQVFLYCFQYDPQANSYVADAFNLMKIGGLLTVLALGAFLVVLWRRETQKHQGDTGPATLTSY